MHNIENEPVEMWSELDEQSNELRKIEVYTSGKLGYACGKEKANGSKLSIEPLPNLEEINNAPQFKGKEVSKTDFERMWDVRKRC